MKKILLRIFVLSTVLMFYYQSAFAQQSAQLTLDDAIKLGLENSHQLNSAKMNVNYREANYGEVRTQMLPTLQFYAGYTRLSEVTPYTISGPFGSIDIAPNITNNYTMKLSLAQPLFTGYRLSSSSEIAENSFYASQEYFTQEQQDLILKIKTAYWNVFKAKKINKVIDENILQTQAHLNDVKSMFDRGMATNNELLKVEVQLAEAKLKQMDAQNSVKLAKLALNNTLGLPLTNPVEINEDVDLNLIAEIELNEQLEKAYQKRPELKAMDYNIKSSEKAIDLANSGWFPQIYLNGNYYYSNPNQRFFPQQEKFKGSWDVNVSLSYDLWNWNRTGYKSTQAEVQLEQTKDNYNIIKDAITLEVNQNYLNMLQAKEKLSVSEFSVKQAEENYRVTKELFNQGLTINSELLDAEVALLQAKTNYVQTIVDYELAKASLEKSVGDI
ncbi:MAG: TolC family protein [Ignavibacterium sp.]|nr:TolC family protein [Ignavibacterium sp.]